MLEVIAYIYLRKTSAINKIITFFICFSYGKKQIVAHPFWAPAIIFFYICLGYPIVEGIVGLSSHIISRFCERYLSKKCCWYKGAYRRSSRNNSQNQGSWNDSQSQNAWSGGENQEEGRDSESQEYWNGGQQQDNQSGSEQKNEDQSGQNDSRHASGDADELHRALDFYGLAIPFSEVQLKAARRKIMKTVHPDAGGDEEDAKKVNVYFDVLKRYAA